MNSDLLPTRREAIAALPGGAAFLAVWLKAGAKEVQDYQPKFFSPEDFEALQAFTEILIPSGESPGAREAHCVYFIDFVLHSSDETPRVQIAWRKAMEALKDAGFHGASASRRLELVSEISQPEIDRNAKHPAFFAYALIKQQNAFAFYTSREGLMQTLDYKGNSYNVSFPACTHPEHQVI